jgi:small subunit ribosomal protein S17
MTEQIKRTTHERKLKGIVTSNKMEKTITVKVDQVRVHAKYGKRYTVSNKYQVHDEKQAAKVGDQVEFIACRPISKMKRWRLLAIHR